MSNHISGTTRVVLFDYDDTLVGTIEAKYEQHKHIARTYFHKELTNDEINEHWGKPLEQLIVALYGASNAEKAMEYYVLSRDSYPKKLFPFTIPALHSVHDMGKLIGIITASSKTSLENQLKEYGIPLELISYMQTADDTDYHKPDPRVFEPTIRWLSTYEITPKEVLYIGDSLNDMKAALGAGFTFIGVETGLVSAQEFSEEGVSCISSLKEIVSGK
jgi:HAD superfamily hydrolase (TIGR01662 family)